MVTKQNTHLFCVFIVYGHFDMPIEHPSLVGIPELDLGNLLSVLEAPWVQTFWRLVMFSVFEQKSQKTQ